MLIHYHGNFVQSCMLTSDITTNSSLNSFKSAVDNYFYDFRFMFFIVNAFYVINISVDILFVYYYIVCNKTGVQASQPQP